MRDNFPNLPCNLKNNRYGLCRVLFQFKWTMGGKPSQLLIWDTSTKQIRSNKVGKNPNRSEPIRMVLTKPHPKRERIWAQEYEVVTASANLMDYPTDEMVTSSWKNGIFAAQQLAKDIGTKPSTSDEISGIDEHSAFPPFLNDNPRNLNKWFYQPFTEFAREFGDIGGEDEDDDIANLEDVSDNISVDTSTVPSDNDVDFIIEPSEGCPFDVGDVADVEEDNNTASKVLRDSSKVNISDTEKEIYKSTLVALLNRDPKLSHDRLKRVRQRTEYERVSIPSLNERQNEINLFQDYTFISESKTSFLLLNIQRIILSGKYGSKDYKKPVKIDSENKDLLECIGREFIECRTMGNTDSGIEYNVSTNLKQVRFSNVLCEVDLIINDEKGNLILSNVEAGKIDNALKRIHHVKQSKDSRILNTNQNSINKVNPKDTPSIYEPILTVVEPDTNQDEARKSGRKRTVRVYFDD